MADLFFCLGGFCFWGRGVLMFFISAIFFQAAGAQCAPLWVDVYSMPIVHYKSICRAGCPHPAAEKPYHLQQTLQITCRGRCSPSSHPPGPAISPTAKTRKSLSPLIYAPYCKPQPALSVDISFFPAVYYTSVCANFLGKGGYGMSVKAQVLSALDAARGRYILRAGTCRPARRQPGRHLESRHCPACGRHPH